MKRINENGMTLVELLVVVVILGILSVIAVIGFSTIIQKSKDQAFVANAYSLKEAAEKYYLSSGLFTSHEEGVDIEISFTNLLNNGFIERFEDPYTNDLMSTDGNGTIVTITKTSGNLAYYICYLGETRQLCDGGAGIQVELLKTDLITDRP